MKKVTDSMRALCRGFCTAVVVAAGASERMGANKLFLELEGVPVLARTLLALERCGSVDELIVVTRESDLKAVGAMRERWGLTKLSKVVLGGKTRTESALAGVTAANRRAKIICIHDGARPLVTAEVIEDAVRQAVLCGAAAPALPVKDTVKRAEGGDVVETPDRESLYAVQTPQAFRAELIKAALTRAVTEELSYTDDCAAAEAIGVRVRLSRGDEENLKLTTPADLDRAALILRRRGPDGDAARNNTQDKTGEEYTMRIGHGYDVHRLEDGRRLILGGVEIPHTQGLQGHSDADVLAHALMDALLGAAALGDIGALFPDSDPAYEGADSLALLRRVTALLAERGWRAANADCTVVAEAPKLRPYIEEMRKNLAEAMGVEAECVSVKATTEEGLGFTGRGEGIGAHAVCLLERAK